MCWALLNTVLSWARVRRSNEPERGKCLNPLSPSVVEEPWGLYCHSAVADIMFLLIFLLVSASFNLVSNAHNLLVKKPLKKALKKRVNCRFIILPLKYVFCHRG